MKTQKTIMGNAFKKFMLSLAMVLLCAVSMQAQVTIGGNVFGGGRMADVNGKTDILVIGQAAAGGNENKTVIHGIFGGNDIAGGVVGADGSTIVIGADPDQQDPSSYNGNNHAIEITEVYGAGNGYYTYPSPVTVDLNSHGVTSVSGTTFTGVVKDFENESNIENVTGGKVVPHIRKTDISVLGSAVKIGDLFGGAKNAFVLDNCATAVNIKIDDGIIHSVFGGNNVGGSIPGDIEITVNNTKIVSPVDYTNIGQTFGIYELYGGGNKVVAPGNVTVNVKGGMIDQCFAGGNSATVGTGSCTVDGNPVHNGTTVLVATTGDAIYTAGTDYNGQSGVYNIRTLFGGNNQAAMSILPTLTLTKGGIGTVYGGGNAGAMTAANTTKVDDYTLGTYVSVASSDISIDALYGGCKSADVSAGGTYVAISNGNIGYVYGGCNISGTIADVANGGTNVIVSGGSIAKDVFGGSNGYYGCRDAVTYKYTDQLFNSSEYYVETLFPLTNASHVTVSGGAISGSVYGGGKLAPIGTDRDIDADPDQDGDQRPFQSNNSGLTSVTISGGVISKNVFAGGMMADVYGTGSVEISAGSIGGSVYGGNDVAGSLTSTTSYSATNSTSYTVSSHVKITGVPTISGDVFGSGNGDYTYYTSQETFSDASESNKVLVCAASSPTVANTFVDVNVNASASLNNVYAGGNNATATESATVLLNQSAVSTGVNDNVATIFGGNNKATMTILPDLILTKGRVTTVYGGGNMGEMTAANITKVTDHTLGTYVELNNTNVTVSDAIYGGGRVAGVTNEAYVKLSAGNAKAVFGGNDIAGNVGSSYIDLCGATVEDIYGGGNGYYDYESDGVYAFGHTEGDPIVSGELNAPNVNSAKVYLNSGTANNVYGGGLAGDVFNTTTTVTSGATISQHIFGGGCGNIAAIGTCADHVGNVTGTATLNIEGIHADMTNVRIFGGGRAGDVKDAIMTVSSAVDQRLKSVYGGCLASNLWGTTTITIGASNAEHPEYPQIDTVYGGNDYAGLTNKTNLTINNGTFTHVFGGGNGDYNYVEEIMDRFNIVEVDDLPDCLDTLPYSMDIQVTYNGGTFVDRVYGGGNMALVGDKRMNQYFYAQGNGIVNNASNPVVGSVANYNDDGTRMSISNRSDLVGHINVDVHGGTFEQHIFLGARGDLLVRKNSFGFQDVMTEANLTKWGFGDSRPSVLAYAYKQFNMDGGHVEFSVYGGSEAVDDGFPYECYGDRRDKTSMAPSTVLNIVGGTVENRVYGGGYKGNCYGSIYVNVGKEAVYDCPVWTLLIGVAQGGSVSQTTGKYEGYSVASPYTLPSSYFEKAYGMRKSDLYLNSSIYNGSDWGEAGANQYFNTRGFFGGVGRICVDGMGYQTKVSESSENPEMNIQKSIIGAGTSTNPGDINSRILVRNYGEFYCPTPSKRLYSIQRTDYLYLENSYFTLTGEQDAYQSYMANSQSLCRIDTVIFHGSNVLEQSASSIYIGMICSEDWDGRLEKSYDNTTADMWSGTKADCESPVEEDVCQLLSLDIVTRNTFLLDNGTYVDVYPFVDKDNDGVDDCDELSSGLVSRDDEDHETHQYGPIEGYLYLHSSHGTRAYVYARDKINGDGQDPVNPSDGGFVSPCRGSNTIVGSTDDHEIDHEIDYTNVSENPDTHWPAFRSWSVGQKDGTRSRYVSIVAHADPDKVTADKAITKSVWGTTEDSGAEDLDDDNDGKYAYATASLELPPSSAGHYYKITAVSIDNNNGNQVKLIDYAWDPGNKLGVADTCGSWHTAFSDAPLTCSQSLAQMKGNPDYTFGLMMSMGNMFNTAPSTDVQSSTIISGNTTSTAVGGGFESSRIVENASNVIPTLDFSLAYRTDFSTTISREVTFVMMEYDQHDNQVGPVNVTLTISTVISEFQDLEARTLAMYNRGKSNAYVRQVVIPASFIQRTLYLDKIEWHADTVVTEDADHNKVLTPLDDHFNLRTYDSISVTDYLYNDFSVTISPTEDVTQSISNSLGWYRVNSNAELIDPFALTRSVYSNVDDTRTPRNSDATSADEKRGFMDLGDNKLLLGVLDGRAAAPLNVTLHFNGNILYENYEPLGWLTLKFSYINNNGTHSGGSNVDPTHRDGTFELKIRIRTRESGDTIYMAEPKQLYMLTDGSVYRKETNDLSYAEAHSSNILQTLYRYDDVDLGAPDCKYRKNDPVLYLSDFSRASDVYEEGDVICILDTIHIPTKYASSLRGSNFDNIMVTRYSGSHFRFPGESAAYRGPMIMLEDGAKFTAANAVFDGGGVSRVAYPTTVAGTETGTSTYDFTNAPSSNIDDPSGYTIIGTNKYSYHHAKADTLFAEAPIFWLEGNSMLNLLSNVQVTNNYNKGQFSGSYVSSGTPSTRSSFPGGAIGMRSTNTTNVPQVILGNLVDVNSCLVVDHQSSGQPLAYGGAIYSDGGNLTLSQVNAMTKNKVLCDQNYYIPQALSDNSWIVAGAGYDDLTSFFDFDSIVLSKPAHPGVTIKLGYYDLQKDNTNLYNSNVFLTRHSATSVPTLTQLPGESDEAFDQRQTDRSADYRVFYDSQSDLINVVSELSPDSRIGVSKWFPGFRSRDTYPRDTIAFASYSYAGSFAAQNNINGDRPVFFDDSASYTGSDLRFGYRQYADVAGDDDIDIRFSTLMNPTKVYFHRCATFMEADHLPIMYAQNPHVVCPGDGDTIIYNVKGGSARYTFKWQLCTNWNEQNPPANLEFTTLTNPYGSTSATGTGKFLPISLARDLSTNVSFANAYLRVTATEAGGCEVSHDIDILMKPAGSFESSGSSDAEDFAGGRYFLNDGDPYFKNVTIDNFLAPRTGDLHFYTSEKGDDVQTRPEENASDPYIHYPVPGVAFISHTNPVTYPVDRDVAKVVRLYSYYKLAYQVVPDVAGDVTVWSGGERLYDLRAERLCPGDIINLKVAPHSDNFEFMMWDYDPSAGSEISYIVNDPDPEAQVTAYLAPNTYWYQAVDTYPTSDHYEVDYHGNVHIKDEIGLAWFISTVNGLNGQQAQSFIFDSVYIYPKSGGYNMAAHKWTPLGNTRLAFRGLITDVAGSSAEETTIKNIIVNENELQYVGLFGVTDSARISNIKLESPRIKGPAYAGALVGYSDDNSIYKDNTITGANITGFNAVGGFAGRSSNSTFDGNEVTESRLVGQSLYAGGMVGEAENTRASVDHYYAFNQLINNKVDFDIKNLSPLYVGGSVGRGQGSGTGVTSEYVSVEVMSNNDAWGTVTGTGHYRSGDEITITAIPNDGHPFVRWSDNNTDAVRTMTADPETQPNIFLVALFAAEGGETPQPQQVTLTIGVSGPAGVSDFGSVTVTAANGQVTPDANNGYTFNEGDRVTLKAVANESYHFEKWSDENLFAEREIIVSLACSTYTAVFAQNDGQYVNLVVSAVVLNQTTGNGGGNVTGSGRYPYGQSVTIKAVPDNGYRFVRWDDGTDLAGNNYIEPQRSVLALRNNNYTAYFEPATPSSYSVSVTVDEASANLGSAQVGSSADVVSDNSYSYGDEVFVVATPASDATGAPISTFLGWYDSPNANAPLSREASYRFRVVNNVTLIAKFEAINNNATEQGEGAVPAGPSAAAKSGSQGVPLYIANNYIRLTSGSEALYSGGLVGYGSNASMENNYAYGSISSISSNGGLVGRAGEGVMIDHCYYENGSNSKAVGSSANALVTDVSTFSGSGNQVILEDSIDGVNNMTRALNLWVRNDSTGIYKTWRSDLDGVNHGYPIFGDPDQIPVYAQTSEVVCDSMNLDGIIITESGDYVTIFSDTVNYVDSILTIHLTVNHGELIEYDETIDLGDEYFGNGFNITDAMIRQLLAGDTLGGVRVLQFVDSLLTEQGCDSIVVLNLSVTGSPLGIGDREQLQVSVYPNPTVGVVNVEGDGLQHVDVYDNSSRQLYNSDVVGSKFTFDLSGKASGSYYLRIETTHGTVVRKVIKK